MGNFIVAFKLLIWWYGILNGAVMYTLCWIFSFPRWNKGEEFQREKERADEKLEKNDYVNTTDEEGDGDPKIQNPKPSNQGCVALHFILFSPQCISELLYTNLRSFQSLLHITLYNGLKMSGLASTSASRANSETKIH